MWQPVSCLPADPLPFSLSPCDGNGHHTCNPTCNVQSTNHGLGLQSHVEKTLSFPCYLCPSLQVISHSVIGMTYRLRT